MLKWPTAMNAGRFDFWHSSVSANSRSLKGQFSPAYLCVRRRSPLQSATPGLDNLRFSVTSGQAEGDGFCEKQPQISRVPDISYREEVEKKLKEGHEPIQILQGLTDWQTAGLLHVLDFLFFNNRFDKAFKVLEWYQQQEDYNPDERKYCRLMSIAAKAKRGDKVQELFDEMTSKGMSHDVHTYTCLVHAHADLGHFVEAENIMSLMVESGVKPNTVTYSCLIDAYGRNNLLDEMARTYNNMKTVGCVPDSGTYSSLIQAYARGGLTSRMEKTYKDMTAEGWARDAPCVNQMIQAYAIAGSIKDMEAGYAYLRNERLSVYEGSIRAMALAYIHKCYFFQLGTFVKNAGLKRTNVKNLLWNLLLLSFAANFSMKNLEREFANMRYAGFKPDLTTFNIRARAFSNMHMYWDLHITVQHMLAGKIQPDLITFDAVMDAYIGGRLQTKLAAALQETKSLHLHPEVRTESFVSEALGKGDFHLFCEELLAHIPKDKAQDLCYADLVSLYLQYLKKKLTDSKTAV